MFRALIRFYQIVISPIAPGNCRYYPSCSEYALIQFEKRNPLVALVLSTLRILRCNQLFEGGFDYPTKRYVYRKSPLSPLKKWDGQVQYYLVPYEEGKVYIVKVLKNLSPKSDKLLSSP